MSFFPDVTFRPQLYLDSLVGESSGQSIIGSKENELALKIKINPSMNSHISPVIGTCKAFFDLAPLVGAYTFFNHSFDDAFKNQCWNILPARRLSCFASSLYNACYKTVADHPHIILAAFITIAAYHTIKVKTELDTENEQRTEQFFNQLQVKFGKVSKKLKHNFKNAGTESVQKIKEQANRILLSKEKIIGEIESLEVFSKKQIKMIIHSLMKNAKKISK